MSLTMFSDKAVYTYGLLSIIRADKINPILYLVCRSRIVQICNSTTNISASISIDTITISNDSGFVAYATLTV